MTNRRPTSRTVWWRLLLAALAAVLVALLGAGTASAASLPELETRVGASPVAAQVLIGPHECITAGQRWGHGPATGQINGGLLCCANAGARAFGNFAVNDLRAAAQVACRNGLAQVGRALQKHSGRDGSVFNGLSSGSATARNEQGLRVLDDILNDPGGRTEVLNRVTNIWDSTGRGVRYGNDGSFMGFLEPVG